MTTQRRLARSRRSTESVTEGLETSPPGPHLQSARAFRRRWHGGRDLEKLRRTPQHAAPHYGRGKVCNARWGFEPVSDWDIGRSQCGHVLARTRRPAPLGRFARDDKAGARIKRWPVAKLSQKPILLTCLRICFERKQIPELLKTLGNL